MRTSWSNMISVVVLVIVVNNWDTRRPCSPNWHMVVQTNTEVVSPLVNNERDYCLPSVLWLAGGGRKAIRPVKTEYWCWYSDCIVCGGDLTGALHARLNSSLALHRCHLPQSCSIRIQYGTGWPRLSSNTGRRPLNDDDDDDGDGKETIISFLPIN